MKYYCNIKLSMMMILRMFKMLTYYSEYFYPLTLSKELNRNGKFQSVIRLYNKYELLLAYNKSSPYLEKVKQQYEYAKDNLESIRKV